MKTFILEKAIRILKARKEIEKELGIKITNRGKEITIESTPEKEYIASQVVEALNIGFPLNYALSIKTEDNLLEIINIKDYTISKDLERIRGRIIGRKGVTLKTLNELTECYFELKDNQLGIIGNPEYIKIAQEAVISLIQGTKTANVYAFLEKHRPEKVMDLGLKEKE